jgi:hypothetical protein
MAKFDIWEIVGLATESQKPVAVPKLAELKTWLVWA